MNLNRPEKDFFSIKNILILIFMSSTLLIILPILIFITMFSHEGGHGIIVVPAIILNREIPEVPIEGIQENPFRNFPLGIFSLFLSFPLGIVANGFLSYLSIKNAQQYRNIDTKKELFILTALISFCMLNFGAILTNFFGQDFTFIVQDFLCIPCNEQWFRNLLRIIAYIVFPLFLNKNYQFEIDKMLIISGTNYLGNTIVVELFVPPLAPILMANFWWLFIFGLFIFTGIVVVLIKNIESVTPNSEKNLSEHKSQITFL